MPSVLPTWETSPPDPGSGEPYQTQRVPLLGRYAVIYHQPGAPLTGRHLPRAVLSGDGRTCYSEGWGKDRAEPGGPARILLLTPAGPPRWIDVGDAQAPVAWRHSDGRPAGHVRKLVLLDRWVRVAVGSATPIPRGRWRSNWFDTACARALLSPEIFTLWEAAT